MKRSLLYLSFVALLSGVSCSQQDADVLLQYLKVHSVIQSRFATTFVSTKTYNGKSVPEEVHFSTVLPAEAFITNFTMQIGDKIIIGDVREKEEAKQVLLCQSIF